MDISQPNNKFKILKDFLLQPNKVNFLKLFKHTLYLTITNLKYLQYKGFKFPVDNSNPNKYFETLAIDILGYFFQSNPNQRYFVIFNYFKGEKLLPLDNIDEELLYDKYTILHRAYIKQEALKKAGYDPQIEKLKKGLKEILRRQEYSSFKLSNNFIEYFYLMKNNNNLRKDKPPLSYDKLLYITEEAYFLSKNRPEWCHKIFELLENESEYQNFIKKHELLRAIITINMKYVELDGHCPQPVKPMLPELYKAITDVKKETLDWLMPAVIKKYNDKGKISPEQAQLLLQAVDIYLSDFGFYGDTDSIPSYFYEMFPEINSKEYLDKYKNIFETIISKALEDLKKRLKNNSTIRAFGYYYNFGIE